MSQQSIERVELLAFIDAAVGEHLDGFSLLLLLQIESLAIFESLQVVLSTYYSLKHSFLDVCCHALLFGNFHDLIDLLTFEFLMLFPSNGVMTTNLVLVASSCFPPAFQILNAYRFLNQSNRDIKWLNIELR